jgi:hypothetical protein
MQLNELIKHKEIFIKKEIFRVDIELCQHGS